MYLQQIANIDVSTHFFAEFRKNQYNWWKNEGNYEEMWQNLAT